MENLYGDLENYQYENLVSELRNENQELKCKLEEYATSLAKLQKDFDKLSTEYKKLELNYSSLLKTARAEIERKSQLITNLNIEKDKLVISSIQKRGNLSIYRKINDNKPQVEKQLSEEADSAKSQNVAAVSNSNDNVTSNLERKGQDEDGKTTVLAPSHNSDPDVMKLEQKSKQSNHYKDKEKNSTDSHKSKQNHTDVLDNAPVASTVSKIKDRRKSMPLQNRGDLKFSSDEEQDDVSRDHRVKRKTSLEDDWIEDDRVYHDKYRNRRNVPVNIHPSNYDSSRDVYRKSNSWYRDSDRHKIRDYRERYESNIRSRRHYSPDRPHYNIQGEYYNKNRDTNDRPYRLDKMKQRTLVSPPRDKYNQHRRNRDFDGQRFQYEGTYSTKHKLHDVIEEPACKRLRSESQNKLPDRQIVVQDRDIGGRPNSMSLSNTNRPLELSYHSLRSPDYVHLEKNPSVHQIKEIKGIADTKLDDPRLTSKRYIVSTHRDKDLLSTVVGNNVNIKAIDTTVWNKDKDKVIYEMPTLLREKPDNIEELVKDIYVDIDNPMSNLSLESGEICLDDTTTVVSENRETVRTDAVSTEDRNSTNLFNSMQAHDQFQVNKKDVTEIIDSVQQACPTLISKNYTIPKVKQSFTSKLLEDDNTYGTRKFNKKDKNEKGHKKKTNKDKKHLDKKIPSDVNDYSASEKPDNINVTMSKSQKLLDRNFKNHSPEENTISAKDTVEGDLELSDETCDYIETCDQTRYDKINSAQRLGEHTKNSAFDGINKDLNTEEPKKSDYISKERAVFEDGSGILCENKKFHASTKGHEVQSKESLTKTYKEPKTKDIKSKLCDLFGDTSSLITLDDLGIVVPTTTKDLNEYTPLFENTQDAVDLNVEEMEKVQTRSTQSNRNDKEPIKIKEHLEVPSEKKEYKINKTTNKEKHKFNDNIDNSPSLRNIFVNVNTEPEADNTVVKTEVISSGVQNNCDLVGVVGNRDHEKIFLSNQKKVQDNARGSPTLLSIKALATSTPHKPQIEPTLTVPEIGCNSNNSIMTKDESNISSNTEDSSKMTQREMDVPDVRIIVKRRRKPKGPPS